VRFAIEGELAKQVAALVTSGDPPTTVTFTRFYSGELEYEFDPPVVTPPIMKERVDKSLEDLASAVTPSHPADGRR
jgi:hypothetical protein